MALAHNPQAKKAVVVGQGSGLSSQMVLGSPNLESLITVEFRAVDDGTEMTMVHSGLPTEEQVRNHERGWTSCLGRLETMYAPAG